MNSYFDEDTRLRINEARELNRERREAQREKRREAV